MGRPAAAQRRCSSSANIKLASLESCKFQHTAVRAVSQAISLISHPGHAQSRPACQTNHGRP